MFLKLASPIKESEQSCICVKCVDFSIFLRFFLLCFEIVGIVLFIIMLFILFCFIWFDLSNLERNRDSFSFVLVNLNILRLLLVISLSQRTGQLLVSKARCQIRLIMKSLKIPKG